MTDRSLDGRKVLITGASAGIGRETARALARDGADVAVAARRRGRLEDLAAELEDEHGVTAAPVEADVRDEAAIESMVAAAAADLDGLDGLVNNAGVSAPHGEPIDERSTEDFLRTLETNVNGTFYATRAALPRLRETGGNLVFVASFAGQYPRPKNPTYAASKWWVRGFARSLAAQKPAVGVTVVNPAEVRTEFGLEDEEPAKERLGPDEASSPEEVADAIAFALGQDGSTVAELDLYRDGKFGDEFA